MNFIGTIQAQHFNPITNRIARFPRFRISCFHKFNLCFFLCHGIFDMLNIEIIQCDSKAKKIIIIINKTNKYWKRVDSDDNSRGKIKSNNGYISVKCVWMPQTQIGAYIKNICIKNKQQATNQQHTAIIHLKNAQVYDLRELHWEKCPPNYNYNNLSQRMLGYQKTSLPTFFPRLLPLLPYILCCWRARQVNFYRYYICIYINIFSHKS